MLPVPEIRGSGMWQVAGVAGASAIRRFTPTIKYYRSEIASRPEDPPNGPNDARQLLNKKANG